MLLPLRITFRTNSTIPNQDYENLDLIGTHIQQWRKEDGLIERSWKLSLPNLEIGVLSTMLVVFFSYAGLWHLNDDLVWFLLFFSVAICS